MHNVGEKEMPLKISFFYLRTVFYGAAELKRGK
jgi:hypothetical protein